MMQVNVVDTERDVVVYSQFVQTDSKIYALFEVARNLMFQNSTYDFKSDVKFEFKEV